MEGIHAIGWGRGPASLGGRPAPWRRRAATAVALLSCWPAGAVVAAEVTRDIHVMGTRFEVVAEAQDHATAVAGSEAAIRAVERTESRLSTWRDDTELSRLNNAASGEWVSLSPPLRRELAEAVEWWVRTDGRFHPGLAALVRAWDIRGRGRVPGDRELEAALGHCRMETLELGPTAARRLDPEFGIDEGGFGKGIALRHAAEAGLAAGARRVRLDLGGQIHLAGRGDRREIDLAHPRDRQRPVAVLTLASGSVATSGNSERGRTVDGVRLGHLLDPNAGRPAPDFGSVTVVAEDPVAADCLATALYVMGPEAGAAWVQERPGVEAIFAVDAGGTVVLLVSAGLAEHVVPSGGGVYVQSFGSGGKAGGGVRAATTTAAQPTDAVHRETS